MLKFMHRIVIVSFVTLMQWETRAYEKMFPFEAAGSHYQLCVFDAKTAIESQSEMAVMSRDFMKEVLASPDSRTKASHSDPTIIRTPEELLETFLTKQLNYLQTRILVLKKKIEEEYLPVGMGKIDRLDEMKPFFDEASMGILTEKYGSLDYGYCVGGVIAPAYQKQRIATNASLACIKVLFEQVYLHSSDQGAYVYIQTKEGNEPILRLAATLGLERLGAKEGRFMKPPVDPSLNLPLIHVHEFVYKAVF